MQREEEVKKTRDELLELMQNAGVDAQPLEIQLTGGRALRPIGTLGIAFIYENRMYHMPMEQVMASGPAVTQELVKSENS